MTQVGIIETPGGDQPLAKAEGDVAGFTTQLAEATAYVDVSQQRVARVTAEANATIADAQANLDRANADVARLEQELAAAQAAIPAAQTAQAAYDALPQDEKDRLEQAKQVARLQSDADAANAALAQAQADTTPEG